jgi:hypothetical protein
VSAARFATGRRRAASDAEHATPRYELRARRRRTSEWQLDLWQLPNLATPHLKQPRRVAGLEGRNLSLVEHRVLKQLKQDGIDLLRVRPGDRASFDVPEDRALRLGLAFRLLAPMRNAAFMRACVTGIDAMGREEAAYWLGMAMHRRYPRRVLQALRVLLVDPKSG